VIGQPEQARRELLRGSSVGPSLSDLPTNRLLWLSASVRALSLRGSDCRNLRSARRLTPAIYGQASAPYDCQDTRSQCLREIRPRSDNLTNFKASTEILCAYV
jgi:hypothetical protein